MKEFTYLISLENVYTYLEKSLHSPNIEYQPNVVSSVLDMLVESLLNTNKDYGTGIKEICELLSVYHFNEVFVTEICDTSVSLILSKITEIIPDFADDRCRGKYTFKMVKRALVRIKIQRQLYDYFD